MNEINEIEYKYEVKVERRQKAKRLDLDTKAALRAAGMINANNKLKITGISAKMLKVMKMEYVNCPVLEKEVQFVQCYVCTNFQSRIKKAVRCLGKDLEPAGDSVPEPKKTKSPMMAAALKVASSGKNNDQDTSAKDTDDQS